MHLSETSKAAIGTRYNNFRDKQSRDRAKMTRFLANDFISEL